MRRIWLLTIVILALPAIAAAQGSHDYHKIEAYGGFSTNHVESNLNQASFTSGGGTQTFNNLCSTATGAEIGLNSQKFFFTRRYFNGFYVSISFHVPMYVGHNA